MPEPYSPRMAALWDACKAGGTTPTSIRKAALLDALKVENKQPVGSVSKAGLYEAVKSVT